MPAGGFRSALIAYSTAVSLAVAVEVAIVVFMAPVAIYNDYEVLIAWGWIAPPACLMFALLLGAASWKTTYGLLGLAHASGAAGRAKVLLIASAQISLVVGFAIFLSRFDEAKVVKWSEEVSIGNGAVVKVFRTAKGHPFGYPDPTAWDIKEYTLAIFDPSSNKSLPIWRQPLLPFLIDFDATSSKWHLIARPKYCDGAVQWGQSPKLPFVRFVLDSGSWTRVPLGTDLVGRTANLLISPRSKDELPTLGPEEVNTRNRAPEAPSIREFSNC